MTSEKPWSSTMIGAGDTLMGKRRKKVIHVLFPCHVPVLVCFYFLKKNKRMFHHVSKMEHILRQWHECPFYGYRRINESLRMKGIDIGEKRVGKLMEKMELQALYPKPRTTKASKEHKKHKYLLRNKEIRYPNQVWASDITYLKLGGGGHVYLVVILDLYSGKVLSWSLSDTMDRYFRVEALDTAINRYGVPAIFNTDQGSRFTSDEFTGRLRKHGAEISMNGKGRALDNVFVERFFRSLKCEKIHLNSYAGMKSVRLAVADHIAFYNLERPHQGIDYLVPDEMYKSFVREDERKQAA